MPQAQVVVITGASAGVGRASAVAFARTGAKVALLARGRDRLQAAAREVESAGGTALVVPTDVADAAQVARAADFIEDKLGPIDVWINNAMVTVFSRVMGMEDDEYRRVTDVNYLGTVYGTRTALRHMRPRNRGVIIQVGSALAYRGIPIQSAYCASKFAVRGFTDSLRSELIDENLEIHLTVVHLAAFNTPQFDWSRRRLNGRPKPLPPIFQPEVAAEAIVWSASHKRRELYVGFPAFKIILGNKLMPGLIDHLASKKAISGQVDPSGDPEPPGDNLFDPIPGDFGIHGRFDKESKDHSWHLQFTQHRVLITLALLAVVLLLLLVG